MISFLIITFIIVVSLGYAIIRNLLRIEDLQDIIKTRNESIDDLMATVESLRIKLKAVKNALE